ncbi:T9SS type A sorting domain-containing protein [Aequorivita todarodis]|uniref:T9SS type A sorting domain-containing protein n=1 Tax=Aequorivita todarodis TaxID=2036821 RepID=UPI0023505B1E|nr:T9SS type A sorting domain-containing protein [Aequorivita todarodis]MDC8001641.1 T9SS type A sorting domain-containing protein [Aequorivita todarodis]
MKTKLLITLSILCTVSVFAQFGSQQIISTVTEKPYLSIPFDIDNDGFIDVLTAGLETHKMSWYRNLDGLGNFGPEIIINETPVYYLSIDFVDLDNDGDKDILYLSNNARYIAWLENLDGAGSFGPQQILVVQDFITSVIPMDMDNDGDQDLVAAVSNTFSGWIVWYENLDGQGTLGEENLLIQNVDTYSQMSLIDIDNDSKLDIVAIDEVYSQGKIFWYKNLGNATFGPMQIIYQFVWVQSGGTNIVEFQYADVNTDGKKDMVITSVDDNSFTASYWLENLDNQGNFGDLQNITNTNDQYFFYDFDNDSDNDMLLWNRYSDKISWKQNEGDEGNFGLPIIITTAVDFPTDAKAADFDGDGLLDVISASIGDNKLAWYKNNTLSISENEIANYKMYPNPTSGVLHIESTLPISQLSVFNLLGQSIATKQNINQIDLSKAEAGVYLLKIEDANGNLKTHKIVKE